jgi:hypothetical protein
MMTDCAGEIVLTTGSRRRTNTRHRAPGGVPPVTGPPLTVPRVGVPPVAGLPLTVPRVGVPPVTGLPLTVPRVGVPPVTGPAVTGPGQDGAVCWRIVASVSCWRPWPGQARPTACFR